MAEPAPPEFDELALPDGRTVACANPGEAHFLWQEITTDSPYSAAGRGLRPGDVIVDVGAHIGLATLHFADQAPGTHIVAVEAAPHTFAALRRNVAAHVPTATALHAAVGAARGTALLRYRPLSSSMSTLHPDAEDERRNLDAYLTNIGADPTVRSSFHGRPDPVDTVEVGVVPIADILREQEITDVALLKIDVERAELDVLDGIPDTAWPHIGRLVIEVHDIAGRLGMITGRLATLGYQVRVTQAPIFAGGSVYTVLATRN